MIAKLSGILDSSGADGVVIDVGGVGYLVFCSARTLRQLPGEGEAVRLVIETHVREDHIHLYGFIDEAERGIYRLLLPAAGANLPGAAPARDGAAADAVSALVNLGYRRVDAFGAVAKASRKIGGDPDLDALIRGGLKELAP